jgi:hypothetical protein
MGGYVLNYIGEVRMTTKKIVHQYDSVFILGLDHQLTAAVGPQNQSPLTDHIAMVICQLFGSLKYRMEFFRMIEYAIMS